MSAYGKNFSTRLFIQAAFTGFLAPLNAHGSTWLVVTFAVAGVAALLGAVARGGHERTRELVIGFEAVAVAVGAVGLLHHHYIPGTIVGIAALVTALNHAMPRAVAVPAQAAPPEAQAAPQFAAPSPQFAAPAPQVVAPAPQFAAPDAVGYTAPAVEAEAVTQPLPVTEPLSEPVPAAAPPVTAPVTGVRAMNILPGK